MVHPRSLLLGLSIVALVGGCQERRHAPTVTQDVIGPAPAPTAPSAVPGPTAASSLPAPTVIRPSLAPSATSPAPTSTSPAPESAPPAAGSAPPRSKTADEYPYFEGKH